MWMNGIHWKMEEGVTCYVEMVNNSKGMVVIAKSEEAQKLACTSMLFNVVREIHQAKKEFCETVTLQEYMMDSDDPTSFVNEDKLFCASDIAKVLNKGKRSIVSADKEGHVQFSAATVSHLKEYIRWGE